MRTETAEYQEKINKFCDYYIKKRVFKSRRRLLFRCNQVLKGIDITGKNILEIGAGRGMLSSFAAINGAKKVVALEPEAEGSSSKSSSLLYGICNECSIGN